MSDKVSAAGLQSPLHAFGLANRAKPVDGSAGVWANEIPLLGYISLRGNAADAHFVQAATRSIGTALPTEPCTCVENGPVKVLWLSPDEWMVITTRTGRDHLLGALKNALKGIRSQVVDNSGGYTQVLIEGRSAKTLLSHVTVYDLDALTDGRVVGTTFGKASVYMHRYGDGYCLVLRRSFSDYIWRYLERAAKPYGFDIALLTSEGAA